MRTLKKSNRNELLRQSTSSHELFRLLTYAVWITIKYFYDSAKNIALLSSHFHHHHRRRLLRLSFDERILKGEREREERQ